VGGYSDWLHQRKVGGAGQARAKAAASVQAASNASNTSITSGASGAGRPVISKARRLSYKDQRELEAMPDKIQRLEAEQLQLQTAIADPALFQGNTTRGSEALARLQTLTTELENAYSRWDALESES
jgi:ABC transport system ATP-binding/permease protein